MPGVVDSEPPKPEGRLLLISNRLPITIKRTDDGKYETSMSAGGLVSGLSGLRKTTTFQWYGWPGMEIPENEVGQLKEQLKEEYNAVPVMLDDDLADRHYNGFSSEFSNARIAKSIDILTLLQMRSSGLSSTTTLVKSPLTNRLGKHTPKQTVSSQKPWLQMFKTMILSGSMTTT